MRIMICPECRDYGIFNVKGYDEPCVYCHHHGRMNIREWLYWKYATSRLRGNSKWDKPGALLRKLAQMEMYK